jgi:hypothetical protein
VSSPERGQQRGSHPAFFVHLQLVRLSITPEVYALGLERAAEVSATDSESIGFSDSLELVVLWLELAADDLASAVERGLQRVFSLIDLAGLPQPGRIEMLAGEMAEGAWS